MRTFMTRPTYPPLSEYLMARAFLSLLLVAVLYSHPAFGQAQDQEPIAPELTVFNWVVKGGLSEMEDPSGRVASVSFSGDVPLRSLLPQTSPDSRITIAGLTAGIRSDDDTSEFAYRFQAFDLALQRAWWSGSVTILDLASQHLMEHDRTWFVIGTGPGFHQELEGGAVSARLQGVAGRRSALLHDPASRPGEGSGWMTGVQASISARLKERLFISGDYAVSQFSSGELTLNTASVQIKGMLSSQWMVEVNARTILDAPRSAAGRNSNPSQIGIRLGYVIE